MSLDFSTISETKSPLDLASAKQKFMVYVQAIDEMVRKAKSHEVIDEATSQMAVSMAADAKRLYNKIEKQRKELIEQPNLFVRSINSFTKAFLEKLKKAESELKAKISNYQYKVELERREQERKAQEAARRLQEQINQEAKEKGVEPPIVPTPVIPKAKTITRTEEGASASQRTVWEFEVTDITKVPREYLMLDKTKVKQAIKMGIRQIPGIKIFESKKTILRT